MRLSEIAKQLNVECIGDCEISSVADISKANKGSIAFVYSKKYEKFLQETNASAVIISPELESITELPKIIVDQPRLLFAKVATLLYPDVKRCTSVSDSAIVHPSAKIGENVGIDDGVVVQEEVTIASGTFIGSNSVIAKGVSIGRNVKISPNVSVLENVSIGDNCILHSGCVIGADGFGFVPEGDRYFKIPQIGGVIIGSDVEVGANSTIDRGAIENTVIGDGVKIDNQIQIAHNVVIGDHTVISAGTAIAGTTKIGKHCLIGGCVAIRDNIEITDNVILTGRTLVTHSITESGSYSSSTPIDETKNWRKNSARFRTLDALARRVKKLESKIESFFKADDSK